MPGAAGLRHPIVVACHLLQANALNLRRDRHVQHAIPLVGEELIGRLDDVKREAGVTSRPWLDQ
jgi:hypothetical protein